MASPTFDFDDQLSEDWISQPRSSDETPSPSQSNLRSSFSHSRIPLPTKPVLIAKPITSAAQSSVHPSPRPLHTKSKSELNIPILKSLDTKANARSRRPPSASRSVSSNHRRSSSAQSWTADGTSQQLGSEVRHAIPSGQMTPEWRRRLLKGQSASEQKDLFSPIGLENVFRPPSARGSSSLIHSPKRRNQTRPRAESSMIYPSSPPLYPSTRRRRATTKSTSPSPLRERHEHDHNQCLAKGGKCEGALKTPTPTRRQARVKMPKDQGQTSSKAGDAASKRIQSGTSIAEHESISPVTIENGQIDYRSIQKSVLKLRKKMVELGLPEQERPSSRSSENGLDYGTTQRRQALVPEVTITSLVDQSVLEPESFVTNAAFVNLKRGGFSSDDNFHRRPLSPSSFRPDTTFLSERNLSSPQQPHRPTTPRPDERFTQSSPEKPRSGGSPLKLFGQHDTFTNNHLMRRLSQYVTDDQRQPLIISEPLSPSPQWNAQSFPMTRGSGRKSDFGAGTLDKYEFGTTESFLEGSLQEDDPSLPPVLPPRDNVPPDSSMSRGRDSKRRTSRNAAKKTANTRSLQRLNRRPSFAEFRRSIGDTPNIKSDGKRALYSPTKDHQSKRRRTLLSSVGSPHGSPEPPSYGLLIGKKRTDALPGEPAQVASPEVMAQREVLRPRSIGSPRTRRSSTSTMSSWLGAASSRQVSEQVGTKDLFDASTKLLAEDLANFAVGVAKSLANGERKTSVTTADFQKEAKMIMMHLRGQPPGSGNQTPSRRTPSGRASGDVSFADHMSDIEELDEESIRSLRSLQKQRSIRSNMGSVIKSMNSGEITQDGMAKKLNKFKETDDFGLTLGESVSNLKITPDHVPEDENLPETDAPHIRILNRTSDQTQHPDGEAHTIIRTRSSTDVSVNRSIRTGGSNNSSRKYNIAPETVKGLLSDHVGRMVFDHAKGLWVRNRSGSTDGRPDSAHVNSDGTEEDPLKSIPDLEDDYQPRSPGAEFRAVPSRSISVGTVIKNSAAAMNTQPESLTQSLGQSFGARSRPSSGHGADSSQLSRFSKFGSSQAGPETRATSWSTAPPMKTQTVAVEPDLPQVVEVGETTEEQPIGEQPILEPAESIPNTPRNVHSQIESRNFSASLSSSLSQLPDHVLFPPSSKKATKIGDAVAEQHTPVRRTKIATALLRSKEKAKRHLSIVKQRYSDRPVSRIDEQDEQNDEQLLPRLISDLSLATTTPVGPTTRPLNAISVPPPSSERHANVMFHRSLRLEPLSDFTIHHADESLNLDIDYVKKRHGLASHAEIDTRFSIAIRDLVARITDIEPYEPFWDYIRKLNLSHMKLVTLHMLEDFCERIEELDISHNELGQVNGAPESLRVLDIGNNFLTSMTAWGHLSNLHYLDVSNNQIESLVGFGVLPHLRELRIDGNQLTSLDGLKEITGLLKLSVRDNKISDANLAECDLDRLTDFDISGNRVESIPGLGSLSCLQVFRAKGNQIRALSQGDLPTSLTVVDLAENELTALDLSQMVSLQVLDIDCNSLSRITALNEARKLESLSWRDQSLASDCKIEFQDAVDLRHLALSGNKLDLSSFQAQFLNLNALEIASCGLELLPCRFGRFMPNLRYLNLSHNAIKDIKPLIGIKRLQQLHLVENRIHRLRSTATVLEKIGRELVSVDLRVNPITLGFYPVPPTPANTSRARSKAAMALTPLRTGHDDEPEALSLQHEGMVLNKVLQDQDQERDIMHKARLDEGTTLRRKVFELLLYNGCPVLEIVNGLSMEDASLRERDDAWQRLVELKIVRPTCVSVEKD